MQRLLAGFESVLRRQPWVISLVALVPCAYFGAQGVNHYFASSLFKADTEALARSIPSAPAVLESTPSANHHVRDRVAIIHRNVFDSDAGCLDCDTGPPPTDAASEPGQPQDEDLLPPEVCDRPENAGRRHPQACEVQGTIMGAVESDDPLWSMIFISTGNDGAMPYRFGQTFNNLTVGTISWCRQLGAYVLLRPSGGTRCFLAQNMPPRQVQAPPPPPPSPVNAEPGGGGLAAELDRGIERSGNNEFTVRRSLVDRILENQADLMRTTRIMPREEGGRIVGVQLFGVRGNSLLGRLGLQNGDVLNRINGLDIASPDRALEAYSRLRTADHLQVSVTRNGQPMNIDFNIR